MSTSNDVALWTFHQTDNAEHLLQGHPRQDHLISQVKRLVPVGSKLLEIGYGDGYLLSRLADSYECHASDISPENVSQMAERLPRVKVSIGNDDGSLPYADESFDAFVASEVLEHMDDAALHTVIGEIWRILKPTGKAILTFPAREKLVESEAFCPNCGTKFHRWGHKQTWDDRKIDDLFGRFKIIGKEERHFFNPSLNLFGRAEGYLRIALSKFRNMSGMTYVIMLEK